MKNIHEATLKNLLTICKLDITREKMESEVWPIVKSSKYGKSVLESQFKGNSDNIDLIISMVMEGEQMVCGFGDYLDNYFRNSPNFHGVVERVCLLKDKILQLDNCSIASFACGSGIEIGMAEEIRPSNIRYDCYDIDDNALDKIRNKNLKNVVPIKMNLLNLNLQKKYDLAYSAGLLDYFDLKLSTRMINRFFNSLNDGGILIVGNADINAPHQDTIMRMLDWPLIYKTKDELLSIANSLPARHTELMTDSYGFFNYLIIKR